jgi:prephenate dehydratase
VERALAPVENALEGGVDPVLDALALEAPDVVLVGELVHPVSYCLAGPDGLSEDEVTAVLSHPQASAQCARFLRERLPHAAVVAAASTADAVREVAGEHGGTRAALGTRFAAERYAAAVLADGVEDDPGNATRFAWLARKPAPAPAESSAPTRPPSPASALRESPAPTPPADSPPAAPPTSAPAKTALVFWGAGSGSPGWLVSCLSGFADRAINLTRIESRPVRRGLGEYMFFLDLEGLADDPAVAAAIEELRRHAEVVRVLGSFPAAQRLEPAAERAQTGAEPRG